LSLVHSSVVVVVEVVVTVVVVRIVVVVIMVVVVATWQYGETVLHVSTPQLQAVWLKQ